MGTRSRSILGRLAGALSVLVVAGSVYGGAALPLAGASSRSSHSAPASNRRTSRAATSTGGAQTGLTSDSVTVANVAILSGPVPGLFEGAPYGAEAYAAYINSKGGINGRRLIVDSLDDGFSCSNNTTDTQSAMTSAFAFVGSFSLYDNCGAKALRANQTIPDVSYSLDPVAKALPNNFSPQPAPPGTQLGNLIYMKHKYPNAIKNVGALVGNVASSLSSWNYDKAAMTSLGYRISYFRANGPLETDFTSDVLRMRDAGVQFLFLTNEDAATVARVINQAHQQDWRPQVIVSATAYDGSFLSQTSPAAANGLLMPLPFAMYLGQDSSTTPAVTTFLQWMHQTHPSFQPDLFSIYGWTSAELFSQALAAAGPNPTRSGVISALKNIHSFNADGLLPTANPGSKRPPTCWLMATIKNFKFVRVVPPKSGFTCSPGGYYYVRG